MNANKISPKTGARLNRIQNASRCFRAVFFAATILISITVLWSFAGLIYFTVFRWQGFANILNFGFAGGTGFVCAIGAWFCYKLFDLYAKGDLFTAKVVFYIRRIGWAYLLVTLARFPWKLIVPSLDDSSIQNPQWIVWLGLIFNLFPAFLIIFHAWIMDEGRKIQEEQELTV